MKRLTFILLVLAGAMLGHAAQLLNGDFERPVVAPEAYLLIEEGSGDLTGWDLWTGAVLLFNSNLVGPSPLEGEQSVYIGSGLTELEQRFPTTPGVTYTFSMLLATADLLQPVTLDYDISGLGPISAGTFETDVGPDVGELFTVAFTAESTLSYLLLTTSYQVGTEAIIDDVSIVPVPETRHFMILTGLGLICLGCVRRFR